MVHWFVVVLAYNLAIVRLSWSEVTLSLRLIHYKNPNGLTYENRPCDTKFEHDINRDGHCDTAFLFCLVRLPFQNPHNCSLGDHFTGFVGGDDIRFIDVDQTKARTAVSSENDSEARSLTSAISLGFQQSIHFRFNYPPTGIGLIVEVYDLDDLENNTLHDSIDFYGRTLLDLKISRSLETTQKQRVLLRSLFGTYTNLTVEFSLYCSKNFYGDECQVFCLPNERRYDCDVATGQKVCREGYFGPDCVNEVRACEGEPCLNNGTCVVYLQSYLCQCKRGFTGRSCEIETKAKYAPSKCNQTTCVHGRCSPSGMCICNDGWVSANCNQTFMLEKSGCASRPCLHNSTCEAITGVNPATAYRCHCRSGYTGRNCEVELIAKCEKLTCLHGKCVRAESASEMCVCEKNWTGIDCSQLMIPVTQSSSTERLTSTDVPVKTDSSIKIGTNLISSTSLKTELREYLNWLNMNYGISRVTPFMASMTKSPIVNQFKYTPCLSAPCLHNGTCVIKSENTFKCLCTSLYVGLFCEIEKNPCESSPCLNQGACIAQTTELIQCICRPHYTGKFCQYPIPFQPIPFNATCNRKCLNGGICLILEPLGPQCVCKTSFTGELCEKRKLNCTDPNDSKCKIDPCSSNPCLSNGTCSWNSTLTNFICNCQPDYTGQLCETYLDIETSLAEALDIHSKSHDHQPGNNSALWPLAIVFGYIFSLMLVFIIIWFLWYGLTIRPQSYVHTDIPYEERVSNRYQPYRLGVSNPLFFTNQEYVTPVSKKFLTPTTTISNVDQWTRTINQ